VAKKHVILQFPLEKTGTSAIMKFFYIQIVLSAKFPQLAGTLVREQGLNPNKS
jgi:hypothetical protein